MKRTKKPIPVLIRINNEWSPAEMVRMVDMEGPRLRRVSLDSRCGKRLYKAFRDGGHGIGEVRWIDKSGRSLTFSILAKRVIFLDGTSIPIMVKR